MNLPIPDSILSQHMAILGKTGSGKSSVMRLLFDYLRKQGKKVCVIDPKGDWWGARFNADGKTQCYPRVLTIGDFTEPRAAEIKISRDTKAMGKHIAKLVLQIDECCVIGLRGWMQSESAGFWIDFASTLFSEAAQEIWLLIDEAHNFAPKGKVLSPEAGKCIHWTNRILSEARGLGITCLVASQRPAKVHNDTLTCCESLFAMRVVHPADREALSEWIKGCGDIQKGKVVLEQIASLQVGQAYVWSPANNYGPDPTSFPLFQSYDSFKPIHKQTISIEPSLWAPFPRTAIDEANALLDLEIKEQKLKDPGELRRRIRELETELAAAKANPATATNHQERYIEKLRSAAEVLKASRVSLGVQETEILRPIIIKQPPEAVLKFVESVKGIMERMEQSLIFNIGSEEQPKHSTAREIRSRWIPPGPEKANDGSIESHLPKGERALLTAIVVHNGCTKEQLSVLTGYKKSARDSYIKRLNARGLTGYRGDQVEATAEGREALGPVDPLPTGPSLLRHYLSTLPQGEAAILDSVANKGARTRDEIGELCNYKKSARDTYIKRLKARKLLVEGREGIEPAELLL